VIKMLLFLLFGVWHGLFSSRGCDGENNERLYSLRQGEATGRLPLSHAVIGIKQPALIAFTADI
uniref:hypothetical protein n=1 Tax=Serratia microhaemolytica TaxID=2675110 RepID=UPI001F0B83F9